MKKSLFYILIISINLVIFSACTSSENTATSQNMEVKMSATPAITATADNSTPTPTPEPTPIPPITLIIGATGDIMCHDMQMEDASYTASVNNKGEIFDFDHVFRYIKPALEYPDLTIGNLETVFAGDVFPYSGFPYFNSPDEFFYAVADAGYEVLTNANNHSYDQGAIGVRHTIELMDNYGIYHTGTYSEPEDRAKPIIIDVKGVKVGILSNTYGIQHSRTVSKKDQEYMLSLATPEHIKEQVKMLKDANTDIIIASCHWGLESEIDLQQPTDDQKSTANLLSQLGVDVIFGHHTHTLQPIEMISTVNEEGIEQNTLVCWSLGNFIANTFIEVQKRGGIAYAYLSFYPETAEVTIDKCEFLPTLIYNDYSRYKDYHVLPAGVTAEVMEIDDITLTDNFNKKLEEAYQKSTAAITDSFAVPIRYVSK